jgi:glycosyltransferase involved in cell wall biosynthesis
LGIPVVTHAHAALVPNIYRYRSNRLESTQLRTIGQGPIVVPSKRLAEELVAIEPSIVDSLNVISNAVDIDLFKPRLHPLPSAPKKIVSLGHLNHNKNQEFLVDVADHLRSMTMIDFEFVLYGPDGDGYVARMVEKIRARGLEDFFSFNGVTTEPTEVLREAWAYVNCSITETFPLSVLEALASGLPVFATPNAGNREILEGTTAGYLSASPREMAQDIVMLETSGIYEEVSRSARRLAEERFPESAFVERFHELLLNVKDGAKSPEDFNAALLLGVWATDLLARRKQPDQIRIGVLVADREQIAVQLLADEALGYLERQGKVSWVFIDGREDSPVLDTCDVLLIIRLSDTRAIRLAQHFKLAGKPVVFETDDNYFALQQSASGIEHVTWQNQNLEALAKISDAIMVYSAESMRAFSPLNSNTHLLPAFQLHEFGESRRSSDNREMTTIGYMGSLNRDIDFEFLTVALSQIMDERKDVRFQFAGYIPPSLAGHPSVSHVPFEPNYRTFMASVRTLGWDIGLAPLAATTFNMSKTANKYREFGAAGIPAVYSDVPIYREVIEDGVNGILTKNSPRDWKKAILNLIDSPENQNRIRDNAREDVIERYPLEAHAQAKFDVLSASLTRANDRNLALQATESHRGNHAAPQYRSIPIPGPYVERVFEWPGETATLFVSLDLSAGAGQDVILEVVLNGEIILHRLVELPSKPIPVHSAKLFVPGVVSVRLGSVSDDMPTMITESQLARLHTVIRVFGPLEGLHKPMDTTLDRRFIHRVRKLLGRC